MHNSAANLTQKTSGKDDHIRNSKHHAWFVDSNSISERASAKHCDLQSNPYHIAANLEDLRRWLTSEELARLQLSDGLEILWTASSWPPITKSSLSDLDVKRIINSPRLRHDLNFEPEITFRPNSDGPRGQLKLKQAKEYWEALSVELAIWIARKQRITSIDYEDTSPWLQGPASMPSIPWRLRKLLESLKEILRILIPGPEWSAVEQRLDVSLLMQEFEKGACDLVDLIQWLGEMLLRSCSPMRDKTVLRMVESVQVATQNDDSRGLVCGLKNLFGILETMKLDVANHQIRYLRLMMIDDSVHFEQKYFLRKIAAGVMHVAQAQNWFATIVRNELHNLDASEVHLAVFSRSIIDMVMSNDSTFPTTFTFDFDRLQVLQVQFRRCVFQVICKEAFFKCLSTIGYVATPSPNTCLSLLHRVSNIGDLCSAENTRHEYVNRVALEIVREAYRVRTLESLPNETLVDRTQSYLLHALQRDSNILQHLEECLCLDLEDMIDVELEQISKLTPLQLLDRYAPSKVHMSSNTPLEPDDLQNIAHQIAHITVLHWRVWGPILYLQPRVDAVDQKPSSQACATHRLFSKSSPALNRLPEDMVENQNGKLGTSCNIPMVVEQTTRRKADLSTKDMKRVSAASDKLAFAAGGMYLVQPRKPRETEREGQRQRRCSSPLA